MFLSFDCRHISLLNTRSAIASSRLHLVIEATGPLNFVKEHELPIGKANPTGKVYLHIWKKFQNIIIYDISQYYSFNHFQLYEILD